MRCKYGKLKNPKGRRKCKRKPHLFGGKRRGGAGRCRWGKLKNPIGKRRCKKKPSRRGGGLRTKAQQEAHMWKLYKSGSLSGHRRRRRR